jgi:large subunit ribosomal protein L1
MGKKRTAVVGELLSEDDQAKLARQQRQKEAAKAAKMAEKAHVVEAKTTHVAGQKGGERVKDLSAEMLAEAEAVEKKQKEALEAASPEEAKKAKIVRIRGKIYKAAKSKVDPAKTYRLADALKLLRDVSYAKFDGAIELHLTCNEKNQSVTVDLPFATGKTKKIAVADDDTIAKIEKNQIDFDVLITSPAQMGKLVKFAKILGPRGLMPNPKNGTIADDPSAAAKKLAGSSTVTLKTDKDSVAIHSTVGKLSQKDEELTANIKAILQTLGGKLLRVTLKSTMSPGIKLEIPR